MDVLLNVETNRKRTLAMKPTHLLLSAVALSMAVSTTVPVRSVEAQSTVPPASAPADNTAQNARDKGGGTLTPMSQSEAKGDLKLAAAIRRAIVKDKRLSTTAQNIKVITDNGKVTLRGPVNTSNEKTLIAAKASAIAGERNVDNQLDVANQ
jgi:hyperosmotically inducible periplasmic protein